MIRAQDLEKRFVAKETDVHAVRGVSFEVDPGNIFCLLGPNGAGKTTTLLMLVTLVRPTSGTALVAGHDVLEDPAKVRTQIGIALQEVGLDPLQTGREMLELHGRLYGLRQGAKSRADELIELFELGEVADRRVMTYSGGLKRRLDLAMAIVHDPPVLFVDEPTAGLDPASRRAVYEQLRVLRSEGKTILLTTQYLEEADLVGDSLAVIDHGLVVAAGTPGEVKARLGNEIIQLEFASVALAERAKALVEERSYVDGEHLRIGVDDGAARVGGVVSQLQAAGIEPRSFGVAEPTLDDVFLWLTRDGTRTGAGAAP